MKKIYKIIFLIKILTISQAISAHALLGESWRIIENIKFKKPAFVNAVEDDGSQSLLISSFSMLGNDFVTRISSPMQNVGFQNSRSYKTLWPNEVTILPEELYGKDQVVIAGGFFFPWKANGHISILNLNSGEKTTISSPKYGWWYHKVDFWDYNKDGYLDIVAARAKKSLFSNSGSGELVVFLCPGIDKNKRWEEKVLFTGPDAFFELVDFDDDGDFEVISSQFLNSKISYHYRSKQNDWIEYVIDSTIGNGFDIKLRDVNKDGNLDLLVTNHVSDAKAGVFAYEIPTAPNSQLWKKHILYQGFKTTAPGPGQASPGFVDEFDHNNDPTDKSLLVISGDGTQKVHALTPKSISPESWDYEHHVILESKGVVGKIGYADFNGNMIKELYVPLYGEDKILVLEYRNDRQD